MQVPKSALELWGLTNAKVAPATWGLNNTSWFIESALGRHVLRMYSGASRPDVLAEHALLAELASADLPFATPYPIAALDGSTAPTVETPAGSRVAALFERIDGDHLDDDDVAGVGAAGSALALLDRALAGIHAARPSFDARIDTVHPLVGDLDALDELGDAGARFVRRMAGAPAQLRRTLEPRQLIHGDFAFGNVLVRDGKVTGILDFEVASRDARASELAIALRLVLSKSTRERLWRPLLRGYLASLPLTDAEIEALPTLALHHEAVVLAWWLGRYRSGELRRPLDGLVARVLSLGPWLAAHGHELCLEARALCAGSEG